MNTIPPQYRHWRCGLWAMALGANVSLASAALPGTTVIHLTSAQQKTLNIQTAPLKTASVRPRLRLYGQLQRNPEAVFTLDRAEAFIQDPVEGFMPDHQQRMATKAHGVRASPAR